MQQKSLTIVSQHSPLLLNSFIKSNKSTRLPTALLSEKLRTAGQACAKLSTQIARQSVRTKNQIGLTELRRVFGRLDKFSVGFFQSAQALFKELDKDRDDFLAPQQITSFLWSVREQCQRQAQIQRQGQNYQVQEQLTLNANKIEQVVISLHNCMTAVQHNQNLSVLQANQSLVYQNMLAKFTSGIKKHIQLSQASKQSIDFERRKAHSQFQQKLMGTSLLQKFKPVSQLAQSKLQMQLLSINNFTRESVVLRKGVERLRQQEEERISSQINSFVSRRQLSINRDFERKALNLQEKRKHKETLILSSFKHQSRRVQQHKIISLERMGKEQRDDLQTVHKNLSIETKNKRNSQTKEKIITTLRNSHHQSLNHKLDVHKQLLPTSQIQTFNPRSKNSCVNVPGKYRLMPLLDRYAMQHPVAKPAFPLCSFYDHNLRSIQPRGKESDPLDKMATEMLQTVV